MPEQEDTVKQKAVGYHTHTHSFLCNILLLLSFKKSNDIWYSFPTKHLPIAAQSLTISCGHFILSLHKKLQKDSKRWVHQFRVQELQITCGLQLLEINVYSVRFLAMDNLQLKRNEIRTCVLWIMIHEIFPHQSIFVDCSWCISSSSLTFKRWSICEHIKELSCIYIWRRLRRVYVCGSDWLVKK